MWKGAHLEHLIPGGGGASNQALITSFTIDGQLDSTFINNDAGIIVIEIPLASDLTRLVPTIEVSTGVSVAPVGGVARILAIQMPAQ